MPAYIDLVLACDVMCIPAVMIWLYAVILAWQEPMQ